MDTKQYWPRKLELFPGFRPDQIKRLEEKTAHMPEGIRQQSQQDLYRQLMPKVIAKQRNNRRMAVKNEFYQRNLQKPSEERQIGEIQLRQEDLADMIKGHFGLRHDLSTDDTMKGFHSFMEESGIEEQVLLDYLNGKNEEILYRSGMKNKPSVQGQGGIKGYFGRQNSWEWNDQFFGRFTPTDEATTTGGIFKEFGANLLKSGVNLASDIGNMVLNPRDTAKGLAKGVVGGVGNLVRADDRMQSQWGFLAEANKTADAIGSALAERYGSFDKFSKTAYTDPVGAFSDIMSVLAPVAWGAKSGANLAAKGAQAAKLTKTASTLSKVADVAGDIAKVADAVDPANLVMKGIGKGVSYGAGSIKKGIQKLDLWEKAQSIISGLDKETRKGIQNNPYVNEYWGKIKANINEQGATQDITLLTRPLFQEVGEGLLSRIEKAKEIFSETWPLYWKIKEINARVDISPALDKIDDILSKHDIKVKGDWSFDFDYSAVASPVDQSAIKTLIERLESWKVNDTRTVLNLRRVADGLSKWDGTTTDGLKVVRDIRRAVDEVAKEQVPWLKELDELYRARIDDYNEIREGLVYKQGSRKGEIRDNFNQIIKTIGGENRARMAERLSEIAPDLVERVDSIHSVEKIAKAYTSTPKIKEAIWSIWWVSLGSIIWWNLLWSSGSIIWAIVWYFGNKLLSQLSKSNLDKIASTMSPEAIQKLQSINAKLAENADLSRSDRYLLNTIKEKIENYREFDNQEKSTLHGGDKIIAGESGNYRQGQITEIDKGLGKLREWAETKYQLAGQTTSDNFKKWFGDWENDPKNSSKVVNEKGEPLMMYHGTSSDFNIFDKKLIKSTNYGKGFYFTSDLSKAQQYGENIKAVYLDVKNPLDLTTSANDAEFNKWYNKKNSPYDGYIVSFNDGEKMVVVNSSSQIKSATDNIGTFDANNPDIRYQKHGVANPLEKDILAQRATQIQNIRNGKSVEQIAKDYGIDIKIVDKITTPEGLRAYGKYSDGIITLAEKVKEGTAPHELFHATFDLVDSNRKENILRQIEKSKGLDSLNAEEYLADSFSEYFRTGKFDTKTFGKGLVEKIKQYFYQVKQFITGANKNKAQIKKLFDEILDGEIDRDMLGEILGNKKDGSPLNQLQDAKGSIGKPSSPPTTSLAGALEGNSSKSITISPENANFYKNNLKQLWGKSHQHSPEIFLRDLKNSFGVEGNSSYIANNLSDWTHTLRISNHSAKAWNNKLRGHPENNTSIVIKLADTKFKRNKSVDLVEFVYNPENLTPEKMQGIIKGVQDWIDTGEYTDKGYDHTHKSIRATLENGEVKYQRAYHGSPYEFDKFDSANTIPETVSVWIKSKFSDRGRYKDVPVIRKIENETLYQWGQGEGRQFWTKDRKYAEQFWTVRAKTGDFYEIDNGNRMTIVHIEATKDPWKISKLIWNSLENNYNGVKPNRLDGENLSIKEAETLLTKSWKNLNERIMVGIDKEGNLILEDGRHLLEAYRKLWKEIPLEKLWFVNDEARSLFNTLYSKA